MEIYLQNIIDYIANDLINIQGKYRNIPIKYLKAANEIDKFSLDWINSNKLDKQVIAEESKAIAIIVPEDISYSTILKKQKKILIYVKNPKVIISKIGNYFFTKKIEPAIHPNAIIHPNAKLGKGIYIGMGCSIGNCIIGNETIIYSNVTIYDDVKVGNKVIIHSGAVLGSDGFGYERDENNNLFKFPQLASLNIGNFVEIGANTCIDRGALSDTFIGDYTKINNLCHIAHNVNIGKNVIITGHVNISGSTRIEDDVWIGPNATIRDHINIEKGATIGMGAVLTKSVPAGETWIGNPAKGI